jgi:predicted nucleic acid-binding protein
LIAYGDTGFLVSLYGQDAHSAAASQLAQGNPVFLLTPLIEAEFTNAVELRLFRKEWTRREALLVYESFLQHQAAGVFRPVAVETGTWEKAVVLSKRHSARLGVRTLDVLHVASALIAKADAFLTFDARQVKLARAERMNVLPE